MSLVSDVKTIAWAPCAASRPATAACIASMAYLRPYRPPAFNMPRAIAITWSSACTKRIRDRVQCHSACVDVSRGAYASKVVSAEVTIGMSNGGAVLISAVICRSP